MDRRGKNYGRDGVHNSFYCYRTGFIQSTESIANRIRHAWEQAQLAPAELRHVLRKDHGIDLSKTGLHRLETVDSKNPNVKLIRAIAEVARVSPGWILCQDSCRLSLG